MPMNQALEHFIFSNEVSWATFVAPSKALPIISCDLASERGLVIPDITNYGRARGIAFRGEKPVAGTLELHAFPNYLGSLLKAMMTSVVSTQQGAMTAWRHKLLFADGSPTGSLSIEKQYDGPSGSNAQFARGVKISKCVISCKAKEPATFKFDLVAQDEAWSGGTWENGASAPAAPTTPVPYPATLQLPFRFDIGQLLYGGTLALTSGEIVVTGGTAIAYTEMVEITIDMKQDDVYVLNNTPCVGALRDQGRKISIKMDLDWIGVDDDYVDYHRAGTEGVLQLRFVGRTIVAGPPTYYEEMFITLPRVAPAKAAPPPIGGDKKRRVQTVVYEALYENTTTGKDFGLVIQNEETSI